MTSSIVGKTAVVGRQLSPHSISLAGRKPAESWLKAG